MSARFRLHRTTLVLSLLLLLPALRAQGPGHDLLLRSGVERFDADWDRAVAAAAPSAAEAAGPWTRYVQFDPMPDAATKARLAAEGVVLHAYLPHRTWVTELPAGYALERLRAFGARSVMRIEPAHKLAPELAPGAVPEHALSGEDHVLVRVLALDGHALPDAAALAQRGLEVQALETPYVGLYAHWRVRADRLEALASLTAVRWIEPVPPTPTPDDDEARGLHRNNVLDNTAIPSGYGFNGAGVAMAIADDGGIGPHIDIKGRVTQQAGLTLGGSHGDMVTGIAMGAGNLNPRYRGMATHAYLYMYGISGYPHVIDAVTNLTTRGVHVTSTSYSQGCNSYTTDTRFGDQQIRQNPTIIHVFSAGNSSTSACGFGVSGYGNITGGYKQGKSVIATANLDDSDVRTSSSSRGPASDGRIKPDIAANGTGQMSTAQDNNYQVGGGTSAASPGIAGIIAQLIDAYRSFNGGANPETPLLKATLLNTAEDLGNPGPDFEFGWGRVNALRAVRALEEGRYLSADLTTGASNSHTVFVPAGTAEVRFMVYWLDWEGDPAAAKALVNDLNLTVQPPGGGTLLPLVLDPSPTLAAVSAPAAPGIDDLNNMEQVRVAAPASGVYTIDVAGFAVPQGPQKYYLVWEFLRDEVEVTYPVGGEGFVPGELEKIRWDAYGNTGTFDVAYSLNGGGTWIPLASGVSGSARYVDWTVPSAVSGQALVRVTRGGLVDQSDAPFSIVPVPANLSVDAACPTTVDLSWDPVAGATGYEVYMLGATHMESQGTTAGTGFTVSGTNPVDEFWFAVRATGPGGLAGRRTLAVRKPDGVFACAVNDDISLDALSPGTGVLLDCYDLSNVSVTAQTRNAGLLASGAYTVHVRLDGGTVQTQAMPGLPSGGTDSHTFAGTLDLSAPGTYTVEAWVDYGPDANGFNDTLRSVVQTLAGGATTVGLFQQDFDGFSACGTGTDCEATSCALADGWLNEANGSADDIDWRTDAGGTASVGTGPSGDHTSGSGNYLYLEASGGCEGRVASLVSPCIDLSGISAPTLSFWVHAYGVNMGSLHVDLFDGGTWIEDVMPPLVGDQGDAWLLRTVDLSAWSGQTVNVRFRGVTGAGFESDLALDDIGVVDLSAPPVSGFSASVTEGCVGTVVAFADASANFPSSWSWSFDPPTVTFVGGTTAADPDPQVSFDALGAYDVTLVTGNGAGFDTLTLTDHVVIGNGSVLPVSQDWEGYADCPTTTDCGGTECPLADGWVNAANGTEDDVDWRVYAGSTVSLNTGPSLDYVPGTTLGKYLYLETSGTCNGQEAYLLSPCLDLTGAVEPKLRFGYHLYGAAMGSLHVDVLSGGAWTLDVVPAVAGDQGDQWFERVVDLSPWNGQSITVRVRGVTGTSFTSDMAVDGFSFTDSGAVCVPPTGLSAVPEATSVTATWDALPGALQYNLQGRLSPSGGWRNRYLTGTALSQSGLVPGTTYDLRLRAQCADGTVTPFGPIVSFTTPLGRLAAADAVLQPVPATDAVRLDWSASREGAWRLTVLDATGRTVLARELVAAAGANTQAWNVADWPAGVYTVVLSADGYAPVQHRMTVVH